MSKLEVYTGGAHNSKILVLDFRNTFVCPLKLTNKKRWKQHIILPSALTWTYLVLYKCVWGRMFPCRSKLFHWWIPPPDRWSCSVLDTELYFAESGRWQSWWCSLWCHLSYFPVAQDTDCCLELWISSKRPCWVERFRGSLSSKAARQSSEGKALLGSRLDWGFKLNASCFTHCNL